jgi:hypothetical protein
MMKYCFIDNENNTRYSDTLEGVLEGERVFEFNQETQTYIEIDINFL